MKQEEVQKTVRERYGKIAKESVSGGCGCGCGSPVSKISPCCGNAPDAVGEISKKVGYSEEEIKAVPEGANLGLGCGNPIALASLQEGEVVLDLGSGGGFDCFLASDRVGEKGKVIGVDMTAEMLDKARENARKGGYKNVEFRLGEIENLPGADNYVDVIISNCVINLSNDKKKVFEEAFRVLKPGGRLMVSDIVVLKELPEDIRESIDAYIGCVAGASTKTEYIKAIKAAGFEKVKVISEDTYPLDLFLDDPNANSIMADLKITTEQAKDISASIASVKVQGMKPL
ncbi:MAG: arsenite methyltransferase [Dehalococcoidales bacterium]